MKITVKTTLITLEVNDDLYVTSDGYTKRTLPDLNVILKSVVEETLKLHEGVSKQENS